MLRCYEEFIRIKWQDPIRRRIREDTLHLVSENDRLSVGERWLLRAFDWQTLCRKALQDIKGIVRTAVVDQEHAVDESAVVPDEGFDDVAFIAKPGERCDPHSRSLPEILIHTIQNALLSCMGMVLRGRAHLRRYQLRAHDMKNVSWARWLQAFLPFEHAIYRSALPECSTGDVTAIVAQYLRPYNIDLIVRCLLLAPSIQRVIVSENNPECRLGSWLSIRHPRLCILTQSIRAGTPDRYRIAREEPSAKFLIIDDDLFLHPDQIETLCRKLGQDPDVPHGIFGQRYRENGSFEHAVHGIEGELDILNRVYACTASQVHATVQIMRTLGVPVSEQTWGHYPFDDIALSFATLRRPRCHNVGSFFDCPTQGSMDIAAWRAQDFKRIRAEALRKLLPRFSTTSTNEHANV